MKVKIIGVLILLTVGIIASIFLKDASLIRVVKNQEYSITYIVEPSMQYYRRSEIVINKDGFSTLTRYLIQEGKTETINNLYSEEDIERFIIYALRHGMTELSNQLDSVDILDGSNIYFDIRIGDENYFFGGYMADHVNSNFKRIHEEFLKLQIKENSSE